MASAVTGPDSRMGHEPSRPAALPRLLGDLLGQVLDFLLHLPVHGLQRAPSIRGVRRQRQERDLRLPVIAPQARAASQSIR